MKNMNKLTFKLACFFLSLLVSSVAMAESITSPLIPQHFDLTLFIST